MGERSRGFDENELSCHVNGRALGFFVLALLQVQVFSGGGEGGASIRKALTDRDR